MANQGRSLQKLKGKQCNSVKNFIRTESGRLGDGASSPFMDASTCFPGTGTYGKRQVPVSYNACMEEFETACGWERRPDVAQKQSAPAQGPRKACAVSPFPSQKAALGAGRTFYMKTQGGQENGILSWH